MDSLGVCVIFHVNWVLSGYFSMSWGLHNFSMGSSWF